MRINKLTKIGILIIGVFSFFFTACETENEITEENLTTVKQDYSVNKVKFSEFVNNTKLVETLSELNISFKTKNNDSANRLNSPEQSYYLDTNEAIYIENSDGIHHTYTFAIVSEEMNFNLENIVLSFQEDGTYKAYLTTYTLTEQERINLNNNIDVNLTNKSSIEKLDYNQVNIYRRSNCTFELMTFEITYQCTIDGCWDPEWTTTEYMHVWAEVCSGGGGGGGSGNDPGGNPGGGGGSGGNGGNNNTIPTLPLNPDGTSAVPTFLINALGGESQLTLSQISWINNHDNNTSANLLLNYILQNSMPNTNFIIDTMNALIAVNSPKPTINYFPGKDEGLPFEWWLNQNFVNNNFSFELDIEDFNGLNKEEKLLVAAFPLQALIIKANKEPAETETENRFGNNGLNDKSDAFRHAFFNAMNSNDAGDMIARLFSNAHESETLSNLILEKQMDLYNNHIGHSIGSNASFFVSNQELSNLVNQALTSGALRYLFPIWSPKFNSSGQLVNPSGDPNFYGTNGTNNLQTATHGITSNTHLTPTNQ